MPACSLFFLLVSQFNDYSWYDIILSKLNNIIEKMILLALDSFTVYPLLWTYLMRDNTCPKSTMFYKIKLQTWTGLPAIHYIAIQMSWAYCLIVCSFLSWLLRIKCSLSNVSIIFLLSLALSCILLFSSGLNKLS